LAEFNRAQQAGEAPDLWNMVLPNTGKRLPDCRFDEVREAAQFLAALEAPGAAAMAAALAHEPRLPVRRGFSFALPLLSRQP